MRNVVFTHFLLCCAIHIFVYTNYFCNLAHILQNIKSELRHNSRKKRWYTETVDFELNKRFHETVVLIWGQNKDIFSYRRDFYMALGRGTTVAITVFVAWIFEYGIKVYTDVKQSKWWTIAYIFHSFWVSRILKHPVPV